MAKTSATPAKGAKGGAGRKDREDFLGNDRWDRIIGAAFFGIMMLSVVAFLVLMIGAFTGFLNPSNKELYALLLGIPFIGLPLALVLLVVLIIRISIRRRRENKAS